MRKLISEFSLRRNVYENPTKIIQSNSSLFGNDDDVKIMPINYTESSQRLPLSFNINIKFITISLTGQ